MAEVIIDAATFGRRLKAVYESWEVCSPALYHTYAMSALGMAVTVAWICRQIDRLFGTTQPLLLLLLVDPVRTFATSSP